MPEAPVDENRLMLGRYYDVWFCWQFLPVEGVANAHSAEKCAHREFRPGVFAPDRRHAAASLFACENIGHAKHFLTKPMNSSTPRSFISDFGGYCL